MSTAPPGRGDATPGGAFRRAERDDLATGIGRRMAARAIDRARERGSALVQLTTDKARSEAVRFYERLGFVPSHEGMKMRLP